MAVQCHPEKDVVKAPPNCACTGPVYHISWLKRYGKRPSPLARRAPTSTLAPHVQVAAPGATCAPPARPSVEWSYMDEESVYGRETLRRFREQEAAKPINAPTSPKRASIQTRIRIAVNPDEQSLVEGLARRAGLSLSNYVRTALGMPVISAGRPTAEQEAERAEWVRRKRAKLHPGNK